MSYLMDNALRMYTGEYGSAGAAVPNALYQALMPNYQYQLATRGAKTAEDLALKQYSLQEKASQLSEEEFGLKKTQIQKQLEQIDKQLALSEKEYEAGRGDVEWGKQQYAYGLGAGTPQERVSWLSKLGFSQTPGGGGYSPLGTYSMAGLSGGSKGVGGTSSTYNPASLINSLAQTASYVGRGAQPGVRSVSSDIYDNLMRMAQELSQRLNRGY